MMKIIKLNFLLLLSAGVLSACSDDNNVKKAANFVAAEKNKPPQQIDEIPIILPIEDYIYPATSQRDPFVLMQSQNTTNGPDVQRAKQPLENFALDALKMVGTLRQDNKTWGIIAAPNGMVYKITIGNYLGQHFGKVTTVEKQKIIITETIPNPSGGWTNRSAELTLKQ